MNNFVSEQDIHVTLSSYISVVEDIQLAIDNTSQVDMIFINFRKVFDTVLHSM